MDGYVAPLVLQPVLGKADWSMTLNHFIQLSQMHFQSAVE